MGVEIKLQNKKEKQKSILYYILQKAYLMSYKIILHILLLYNTDHIIVGYWVIIVMW